MSKKKESAKAIENVEQTLTKTEQFLEQNYKPLLYVLVAAVVLVGIVWLIRMRTTKQNEEALSQMFMAEQYFGADSLRLALYGDGNNLGFIDIAEHHAPIRADLFAHQRCDVTGATRQVEDPVTGPDAAAGSKIALPDAMDPQ